MGFFKIVCTALYVYIDDDDVHTGMNIMFIYIYIYIYIHAICIHTCTNTCMHGTCIQVLSVGCDICLKHWILV